ncbi:MAG: LamG-like jellyroll fold domain-containing protein [Planctomycetaceae bacterium]
MSKDDPNAFDGYRKWLGISEKKRPPTHYELLGVTLDEDDHEVIQGAAEQRREFVKTKRGEGHDNVVNEILYLLTEAEMTLQSPDLRRAYDKKVKLFEKRRRDRQYTSKNDDVAFSFSYTAQSRPGGAVSQGTGFIQEYAGIVAIICIAFFGMAAASFLLPWDTMLEPNDPPSQARVDEPPVNRAPAPPVQGGGNLPPVAADGEEQPGEPVVAVEHEDVDPDEPDAAAMPDDPSDGALPEPVLSVTFDEEQKHYDVGAATLVEGIVGKALNCDGMNFVTIPATLPAGAAPRTISVWLKDAGETKETNNHVIAYGSLTDTSLPFGIHHGQGFWAFHGWGTEGNTNTKLDGNWHHHCVTADGEKLVYRYDGEVVAEVNGALNTTAGPIVLGSYANLDATYASLGLIDELAIYDKALTGEQVQMLFERQSTPVEVKPSAPSALPNPVLSVTFDEKKKHYNLGAARLVKGIIGKALKCDGRKFVGIAASLPAGAAPRTIAAWLKNSGKSPNVNHHVIAYGSSTTQARPYGLMHNNGVWACYGWNNEASTTAAVDDQWHHHCMTYDGKKMIYRFDGAIVAEAEGELATTAGPLVLGTYADPRGPEFSFIGLIDEVHIYDTALSEEQVQLLVKQASPGNEKESVEE